MRSFARFAAAVLFLCPLLACLGEGDDPELQAIDALAGEVSLWSASTVPGTAGHADTSAVELGLKFRSSTPGLVTGVRFFKSARNTGTHRGHLWTRSGQLLATVTFTGESTSGWQQARFATPVRIAANTLYVVSYYAPRGYYAGDNEAFTNAARTVGPLTAPRSGDVGGNGVYRYGWSGFPSQSYKATNYYVDVLFVPDGSPPAVDAGTPDAGGSTATDAGVPATDAGVPSRPLDAGTNPSVDCVRAVWSNLEACGWPGPNNTGHPAGVTLRTTPGRTITADNTVVDGERIEGGLVIAARNVTVRNSHLSKYLATGTAANGSGVIKILPGASAIIEHNTLDGRNGVHACIWAEGTNVVARYNDCFGINDGIFIWDTDNFTIEHNYLHGFTDQTANGHIDGFQTEGASHGVIRHNTFDVTQPQDSCVAIWNSRRNADDILVENNLMAGGGFAVYAEDYSPSEANPAGGYTLTNIRFVNNKFSTVHYGCVGTYGVWFPRGSPTDGWRRSGNVVLETGQNVDNGNPTYNGRTCN